jgi:hypothetical protein
MDNQFDIQDDLNVDETNYPKVDTGFKPPAPGNYTFKPLTWEFQTKKDGTVVKWKNEQGVPTYPVIKLNMAEITEGLDNTRKVGLFQQIPTNAIQRQGGKASQAADLLVAIDRSASASNTGEVIRELTSRLDAGIEFRARLDYAGYDGDFANRLLTEAGGRENLTSTQINAIYNRAKIRGYKKIRTSNAQAGQSNLPLHKWMGPSGQVLDVQPVLTVFYPSGESVNLGPDKL